MAKLYLAQIEQMDNDLAKALLPLLPPYRRQQISRTADPGARRLLLLTGGLLRYALRCAGLPEGATVSRRKQGKPYLPDHPQFCFSLSHSGVRAACAVAAEEVGADIQRVVSPGRLVRERCLSPTELRWLESLPKRKQDAGFCRIWSLKEALLKAEGCGLRGRIEQLAVLDEQGRICCCDHVFREFFLDGYTAAVCCRREGIEERAQSVDLHCLLE